MAERKVDEVLEYLRNLTPYQLRVMPRTQMAEDLRMTKGNLLRYLAQLEAEGRIERVAYQTGGWLWDAAAGKEVLASGTEIRLL